MEQLKRAEKPYRFEIPAELVPKLREIRARQRDWRELIDTEDVLHLYYGLGPALFLTFDGRVLVDNWDWIEGGAYEVTDPKEAWAAIVIAAKRLPCPELRQLLPMRPESAVECPNCNGNGRIEWRDPSGNEGWVVCRDTCGGLGWVPEDADSTAGCG